MINEYKDLARYYVNEAKIKGIQSFASILIKSLDRVESELPGHTLSPESLINIIKVAADDYELALRRQAASESEKR